MGTPRPEDICPFLWVADVAEKQPNTQESSFIAHTKILCQMAICW